MPQTMIRYIIFITLFISLQVSHAQNSDALPASHPAYRDCQTVYKQLKKAIGDKRTTLPTLVVLDRKKRVASYRNLDNTIIIEKAAYTICQAMGTKKSAALAFLIGHELTHFYQQTDWKKGSAVTHFLLKHEVLKKYALQDEEADSYSAFIAYLANYSTLDIIPELLEGLYSAYGLDKNLDGYPSLEERKKVVQTVQRKVRKCIQMYESASYYIAIGWNLQAISCYLHLIKFIKTKEIYHNLGVVSLATAIEHPDSEEYSFLYPIDIDLTNIFQRPYAVNGGQKKLLVDAEHYLKKALNFDKNYCSAYLNLSCVYDLQGDVTNALTTLNTASNLSPTSLQRAKIAIIKGIVYAHRNQFKTASRYFDDANKHYQNLPVWYISNANKRILANEKRSVEQYTIDLEDTMDDLSFRSKRRKSSSAIALKTSSILNMEVDFSTQARSYFSRFVIENRLEGKTNFALLQRTRNKALETNQGVKVGDALSAVQKAYKGIYFQVVHHNKGFFLVYPSKGLVFQFNLNNKLREWAIFCEY